MTSPLLYGRETELLVLDNLIKRLAEGGGGALVLRGDAGLGKSALLAAATHGAADSGVQVLTAAGVESEMQLPFAGLHQLLQPLLAGVKKLPGPQRDALRAAFGMTDLVRPELFLIALASLELLADAASRPPLLIIAEDAQWLDRPSSDVLAFVARRVNLEPIVILVAIRDGSSSAFEAAGLPELRLAPLDESSARALLSERAPRLALDTHDALLKAAAGNPLALEELPAVMRSEQLARLLLPDPLPLTARLERAFATRMLDLPTMSRTLLLVAAADDRGVLAELLAAASLVADTTVTEGALDPAISARLVEQDRGQLSFRHPLVRSAIYQAASPAERRGAHAALAKTLVSSVRSLWHRAAATIGPDEELASLLEAGASQAQQRGAIAVAVSALERAAELTDDSGRRGALLLRAAELAFELGRRDIMGRLLREAEVLDLGPLDVGRMMWIREMIEPGVLGDSARLDSLVEIAEEAAASGDDDLALNLLWLAASRCFWGGAGQGVSERLVAAAERLSSLDGDPRLLGILAYAAPIARGRVVIGRLLASADAGTDVVADRLRGSAAIAVGAFDLAGPFLAASAAGLRTQGRLGHLPRVLVQQAWAAIHIADWTVALPAVDEASRLATETNDALWTTGAQVVKGMLFALRGETEEAEMLVAEVEGAASPVGARFMLSVGQLVRGLAALGAGDYQKAYEQLMRLFDPADPSFHDCIRCWGLGDLAEAAVHSGHRDAARELIVELTQLVESTPSQGVQIGLRFARALLADDETAEPVFQAALNADLSRWPFARGRLLLAYGAWLRRQRRAAESRAPLRAARDCFDVGGAVQWGERARHELRASGETSSRRTVDARDQLTAQELQIAQMAADGLSNREISAQLYMSHRTVGSHLYHIFPKLGITSRNRLRTALAGTVASAPS